MLNVNFSEHYHIFNKSKKIHIPIKIDINNEGIHENLCNAHIL
jgi:hypothetical protein